MERKELEEVESVYGNIFEEEQKDCMWLREDGCWCYMPDSKSKCNGKCKEYIKKKP